MAGILTSSQKDYHQKRPLVQNRLIPPIPLQRLPPAMGRFPQVSPPNELINLGCFGQEVHKRLMILSANRK